MRIHLYTLLWAALIAVGLLTPGSKLDRLPSSPHLLAVAAHLLLFLVLTLLLHRSLTAEGVRRALAAAFALSFLYGAALEFVQIPVEGRALEGLDFLMNGLGASVGALAARILN